MSNLLLKADGDCAMIDQNGAAISMRQRLAHFSAAASSSTITGTNRGHEDVLDDYVLTAFTDHNDGTFTITGTRVSELASRVLTYKNGFNTNLTGAEYQDSIVGVECANSIYSFYLPQPFTATLVTQISYIKATNMFSATLGSVTFTPYFINNTSAPPRGDPSAFTPLNSSSALPTLAQNTLLAIHNGRVDQTTYDLILAINRSEINQTRTKRNTYMYNPSTRTFFNSTNTYQTSRACCYRGRAWNSAFPVATLLDYYAYYKSYYAQYPQYAYDSTTLTFTEGSYAESAILYDPAT